jgi:hypothetical protein
MAFEIGSLRGLCLFGARTASLLMREQIGFLVFLPHSIAKPD